MAGGLWLWETVSCIRREREAEVASGGILCREQRLRSYFSLCQDSPPSIWGTFPLHTEKPQLWWAINIHEFSIYCCCSSCYSQRLAAWYPSCVQLSDPVCGSYEKYFIMKIHKNREIVPLSLWPTFNKMYVLGPFWWIYFRANSRLVVPHKSVHQNISMHLCLIRILKII